MADFEKLRCPVCQNPLKVSVASVSLSSDSVVETLQSCQTRTCRAALAVTVTAKGVAVKRIGKLGSTGYILE